jgi:NAD(P)-dependent dehydrogenase (short-subunit alcohol dehydrogenase family)
MADYPNQAHIVPLDVTDESSIMQSAEIVRGLTNTLDLLINNAAVVDRAEKLAELTLAELQYAFRVNAFGPLLMAKAHLDLLKRGTRAQIVSISSEYGSLGWKSDGDLYTYCASKAALNMFTRTLSFDLERFKISAFIIDPGWVRTRMGGNDAELSPEESVTGMLKLIDAAVGNPSHYTGRYLRWNGDEAPW